MPLLYRVWEVYRTTARKIKNPTLIPANNQFLTFPCFTPSCFVKTYSKFKLFL